MRDLLTYYTFTHAPFAESFYIIHFLGGVRKEEGELTFDYLASSTSCEFDGFERV
jgi:hypothetical protein